jgi:uncharacterized protein
MQLRHSVRTFAAPGAGAMLANTKMPTGGESLPTTTRPGRFAAGFSARLLAATVLALVLLAPTAARELQGLYDAEVAVAGQSAPEREQALRKALAEVLVKVSGDRAAPRRAPQVMEGAGRYVQQYGYRTAAQPGAELQLWARFDAAAVDRALQQAGLPVWGRVRPTALVWLAVESGQQRYLLGADEPSQERAALEAAAERRGLPVLLPLLDLEDQGALKFADVWGGFGDMIMRASARYQTEAVLVGRLHRAAAGTWSARWTLYGAGASAHWEAQGSAEEAIGEGVDGLADALAARFAGPAGEREQVRLTVAVTHIDSLAGYARAERHLRGLGPVAAVQVAQVEPDRITFELQVRGGRAALEQAISLGGALAADATVYPGRGEAPGQGVLAYRLLP